MFWPELRLISVFQKESYYNECFFSRLNLATVHLYGCVIVVGLKMIDYIKDTFGQLIMVKRSILWIC